MRSSPEVALSIILPARNEAASLRHLLPQLVELYPTAEIIVVNDGSTDDTVSVCAQNAVRCLSHAESLGNGAAIKAGARAARGEALCFMDADSQHDPSEIAHLLEAFAQGYDMVVGARNTSGQASLARRVANGFYNRFATWVTGRKVQDLTSGFRLARASCFREFLFLLPNGFSYPTTCTMAFFRAGLRVAYVPINAKARIGRSHISPLKDGLRFLLIIFKIGTLFSPLKIFLPISLSFFLAGTGYYAYTYLLEHRFTNMSALLLSNAVLIFLIGLISEQITMLLYRDR